MVETNTSRSTGFDTCASKPAAAVADAILLAGEPGQRDAPSGARPRASRRKRRDQVVAVPVRHADVADHHLGGCSRAQAARASATDPALRTVAPRSDSSSRQRFARIGVVVDDQHRQARQAAHVGRWARASHLRPAVGIASGGASRHADDEGGAVAEARARRR